MAKSTVDNCGNLARVNPLNRLERSNRTHWNADQNTWDKKLADRIYRDMQAFIVRRYPGVRWLVLAEVFLTLGAKAAGKAGVGDAEIVEFIHRHNMLRDDQSRNTRYRVPIAGKGKGPAYAGVTVPSSRPEEGVK